MNKKNILFLFILFLCFSVFSSTLPVLPDDASVNIPWDSFKNILEKILKQPVKAPDIKPVYPPIKYTLSSSVYTGIIKKNYAKLTADYQIEVLYDTFVEVPLLYKDMALQTALLNNKQASLYINSNNYYTILLQKKGQYHLKINFAVNITRNEGKSGFRIIIPRAPITAIKLFKKGKMPEYTISPSNSIDMQKEKDGYLMSASIPATNSINVSWLRAIKIPDNQQIKEPKIYLKTNTIVGIGERFLKGTIYADYTIRFSPVTSLYILIEKDIQIIDISGRGVKDWKIEEKNNKRILHIQFQFPVKDILSLIIQYEKNLPSESFTTKIPEFTGVEIERDIGNIAITNLTNLEVFPVVTEGCSQIDPRELEANIFKSINNPILLSYKYLQHPFSIMVDVKKHKDIEVLIANIEKAHAVSIITDEGKVMNRVIFKIKNNLKQFLKVQLPKNAKVWACYVQGTPVRPARDQGNYILIPMLKTKNSANRSFSIELVYFYDLGKLNCNGWIENILFPKTDINMNNIKWSVYLPDEFNILKTYTNMKKPVKKRRYFSNLAASSTYLNKPSYKKSRQNTQNVLQQQWAAQNIGVQKQIDIAAVPVDIPLIGKPVFLEKTLILPEDKPIYFSVYYVNKGINKILLILFIFIGFVCGYLLKIRTPDKFIFRKSGLVFFIVILFSVIFSNLSFLFKFVFICSFIIGYIIKKYTAARIDKT